MKGCPIFPEAVTKSQPDQREMKFLGSREMFVVLFIRLGSKDELLFERLKTLRNKTLLEAQ